MATTVAAIKARARRDVVGHFMHHDAVSADKAIGYEPERPMRRRTFDRLLRAGVLREAGEGRWWLDVPAYARDQQRRRRFAAAGIMAALVAASAGLFAG